MAPLQEHHQNAYLRIDSLPEYQTFSYHFDYITVIIALLFICYIPSVCCTIKMMTFFLKTRTQGDSKDIHPYVFKSFLCMQLSNHIAVIFDYIVSRIPSTTLLTSYFSSANPDNIFKYFVSALYLFNYISQLYTVLFCFIRVLILFYPTTHSEVSFHVRRRKKSHFQICSVVFKVWSFISFIFSLAVSFPHITFDVVGLQLDFPFQYGAIALTTTVSYGKRIQKNIDFIFSAIVCVCIVVMTLMMLIKMRSLKLNDQHSKLKTKAETTLKITMCFILIPCIMIFAVRIKLQPNDTTKNCLQITSFYSTMYVSYIIVIRPILLDCRVNIVSCYFYMSHPYFKRKETLKSVNAAPWYTN
ncbi:hypothetical protein CRE_02469 [Caenorhabditis remanei]|uniref:G-protein coupled receptors family 1 profile domain-containing protein n=1 Tax=Caenorhabditis remanei TaxID=31234 RepID=E3MWP5_CAERE|nr:hypothetical protein CRE_02469 [Caenorhabditis remanei]